MHQFALLIQCPHCNNHLKKAMPRRYFDHFNKTANYDTKPFTLAEKAIIEAFVVDA